MDKLDQIQKIKANAELVIKTFADENLDFSEKSVAFLDGYIERNRSSLSDETKNGLVSVFGSFLGECIRKNFGGDWQATEYGWAISFDKNNSSFPFNKVAKQFANGSDDSILGFYKSISVLFHR